MSALFVGALAAPAFDTFARWSPQSVWTADRERAKWPVLNPTVKSAAKFPQRVDAFYEDNFGLRDVFIAWNSYAKVHWLQQSPVPPVVIGQDGWLFYLVPGARGPQDWGGLDPLTEQQLVAARAVLEDRQARLAQRGIKYLFVIAPNKHAVYPEHLPLALSLRGEGQRTDSFVRFMREHSEVPVLDLRNAIRNAKQAQSEPALYFRHDSHWNNLGAFVGYRAMIVELRKWFPELPVPELSNFSIQPQERPGDLAMMLGMPDDWKDVEYQIQPNGKPPVVSLRAAMAGDSFGWSPSALLRNSFADVLFQQLPEHGVDLEALIANDPQVVLDIRVERNIPDKL